MQTVTINIGAGPTPGSALVQGGPAGALVGPNYIINTGGLVSQAKSLEFYENGVLAGISQIPPGFPGLNNYWDHLSLVVPVPAAAWLGMSLLATLGGGRLLLRRRAAR